MTDYARLNIDVVVSKNSDYSDPYIKTQFANYTATPTTAWYQKLECVAASAVTVDLGSLDAVNVIILKNTGTANYVTVTFDAATDATDMVLRLGAGEMMVLPDVTVATDLSLNANTTDAVVELIAF